MKDKSIFLIDMQSFYASIEKVAHPEWNDNPVIVSGDPKRRSGVVLAACPLAKQAGVVNAERLGEARQKCPEAVIVRPRMQYYVDISIQITRILERFTNLVEPYSIDEQFMDVSHSSPVSSSLLDTAASIQQTILREIGIYGRIGIGPNKVLAKMACDHFSKKNPSGIFELNGSNMEDRLWPLPIDKMFGVGSRMSRHLINMGIRTIGHLANAPLSLLTKRWGIEGEMLWRTAQGMDDSPVSLSSYDGKKVIGNGLTLPKDYQDYDTEIKTVLLELCEEVCYRARSTGTLGHTITVGCQGASLEHPTGFHRQTTLLNPTNITMDMFKAASSLFLQFWDREPVRHINVSLSQLHNDNEWQLNLLENNESRRSIGYAMDRIKKRYGKSIIVRASSLTNAGQAFERAKKLGGHYK